MRSVGIATLGCKVNTYESEFVEQLLKKSGYEIKDFHSLCDVYIINTCTVTNTSDSKSRKTINEAIKRNPDACVVAMGCFIQANKDYHIPGLSITIGNKDKTKIVSLLDQYFLNKTNIKLYSNTRNILFEDMFINDFPGRTRAFVKIQDGCDNFCTYCIIPYVRGKCRSKSPENVLAEITNLVNNGYYEIVLAGIHTGNYGVDINTSLAAILKQIVVIPGLKRLRISSIEVTELTAEVLEVIKNNDVIVNHFHVPLQSGSDEILKLMNRKYDLAYYYAKIKLLRDLKPDVAITTDVIVGFPGENEELFSKTLNTCQELGFAKIHVFPYSERQGTKAMELPNHVDAKIKKDYAKRLLFLSKKLEIKYMQRFVNKKVEVLVESFKDGYSYGHTSNYLYVKIPGMVEHNTFITVTVTGIDYPYVEADKEENI